jgi:two-component system NtrC family sensor kinase
MAALSQAVEDPKPDITGDWKRALFEAIDDAVFVHDPAGNILEANPAACRRLGYTHSEMLQLNTRDIDDPAFAAGFLQRLDAQLHEGHFRCEGRHRTKDGRVIPVDINTSSVVLDGKPAVLAVMRDITQQKLAENKLALQFAVVRVLEEADSLAACARQILQVLGEGLGLEMGILWLVNGAENCLSCLETWRLPGLSFPRFEEATRGISLDQGRDAPGQAWARGAPVSLAFDDPAAPLPLRCTLAKAEGLKAAHAFPIQGSAGIAGIIEFLSRVIDKPDDDLLSMMEAIGSQIGQVLERQRVEDALRDSEALYQSLVQSLPQNIFRKDREGRVTFANQHYCDTLKRPLAQLLGKTDFDLFPPELAAKYVEDDRRVIEENKILETVEAHHLPQGGTIYVQVVKTPVYDAQGNCIGTQGIFWDVTERKRAEEILAESERRYRQLTEATLDGIVLIDETEIIRLFNPAAERMFGCQAADVIGQPAAMLVPADPGTQEKGFFQYLQSRHSRFIGRTVEITALRKDGAEFPVELALNLISFKGGLPSGGGESQFLCAFRDLTERNKMRSVLVQNEKLASIGLLSAGVAHEINNPLAFVANNLVVLERDAKGIMALLDKFESAKDKLAGVAADVVADINALEEEIDISYTRENLSRLMARTRDGVDRVTRIVHSLRGLARTDTPRRQEISIPDLMDNALEILRGRYKRGGVEVVQDHDPNPRISCVQTQISQVLLNLLVNAYQALEGFRKDGGRIWLRTRRIGDDMLIEVADNGPGIPAEHIDKIFDPFFTTKDVGEGTGLGLSITHNIVTAHGGRIEVHSEFGHGACFRLYLPLKNLKDRS